jgi:hypothetical protein
MLCHLTPSRLNRASAGLRLTASFAEAGQGQERSLFGKLACIGRPQVVG